MRLAPRALRLGATLLAFAAGGVLAGVVWHALWTPPTGLVFDDEWVFDSAGAPLDVSGTALYVVVALATGLVLGLATTLTTRRDEVAVLAAVVVGSALAGVLMAMTGHALGPPDPRPLAAGKEDFTAIDADLRVEGASPYVALPAGALSATAAGFLLLGEWRRKPIEGEPGG